MTETSCGGIVLCGGHSQRMGQPKLSLPFGDELMVQRVCRILGDVVSPVVVVAATEQALPDFNPGIRIVRDEYDSFGPLAGIATGLSALDGEVDSAFVTACDVPLLKTAFVKELLTRSVDYDVAVPSDGNYDHVLSGVWSTALAARAHELLKSGQRRPLTLLNEVNSLRVHVDELRAFDARLDSLRNTNTPEEYLAALSDAGF